MINLQKKKSCFVNSNSFIFKKIYFYEWNDSEYILLWMNEGETWKFIVPVCVSSISYYDAPEM